ncbi:response regulator [Chitinophaga solisilvae]|uniref:Response regulator n=1 Tax=Chitinophaga solisilvae TaxID=1233460 RepID=A0A3S1CRS9_9BACT|nr:response regulator [Chitinophaga solisilvae]NSL86694.1 response regulator [Chitinophaga solisilvae]
MKKKILIIDDSSPIRFLLEALFSKQHAVIAAQDGLVAMSWLSNGNKPDLIITDLQMPNINGWELLDFLADSYLYKDLPVIVLSGSTDTASTNLTARYSNVQAVMSKPFDPQKLQEQAEAILLGQLTPVHVS